MPDRYIKQAEHFIEKYYSLWSDEGKAELKEYLCIAIKNKHMDKSNTGEK
jgi:hypothetical protein